MESQKQSSGFAHPFLIVGVAVVLLLLVSGGAWFYLNGNSSTVEKFVPSVITQNLPKAKLDLTLEKPADGDVISDKTLVIKGKTLPGIVVAMYSDADQNSVEADSSGNFEGTLTLAKGLNGVVVTAINEEGEEKSVNLDIVYDDGK